MLSESQADWTAGTYFILTADIDAADTSTWNGGLGFSPIGKIGGIPFSGDFNGNSRVISNLFIDRPAQVQVGLFGGQNGGAIKNTHLTACTITGKGQVNATSSGARGLVGSTYQATISSGSSSTNVIGGSEVGGLVGYAEYWMIADSFATGQVIGVSAPSNVGGFIGYAFGNTIQDSYATGDVSGIESVGGLVGDATGGSISRCYATGQVSQSSTETSLGFFGGLVGFSDANISSSTATGGVSAPNFDNVGGLVGYQALSEGEINSSYATGPVDGNNLVGGLIGICYGGRASSSYATGAVTGAGPWVGALIGDNNCLNGFLPSYWLDPTGSTVGVGIGSAGLPKGLSPEQMLMQSSFVGFDFGGTWLIDEGVKRPYLLWQQPSPLIFSSGFETTP